MDQTAERPLRIGALAERTGTTTHLLRVWEERYQLLSPHRSASGYRLYGPEDERRVRDMVALRSQGVAAAQAADRVLQGALARARPASLEHLREDLMVAFAAYDDAGAHEVVDRAISGHAMEQVIDRLFFPVLRHLGDAWEAGTITVAQEHYASGMIRGRMLAMAPGQHAGLHAGATGPSAVLACTAHERHDIGLLALNLLLRRNGWRVTFLGADTPVVDAVTMADDLPADVLVLCGTEPYMYAAQLEQHDIALRTRRRTVRLALGGRAASAELAAEHGAELLPLDPGEAAAQLEAARVSRGH
ncbi:MerR family transcriptional regulator [Nocardioides mangrovicus]|uniref:MerR family transcriptional regulator n=1 Tax=Nocardioides mangrovicus TaxID=2478913 RepID=A0A3L8NZ08_9ACTN|nr:MerR family transcriptional regulator [Nocardioides mangrovicus]RLV48134.1 MerR family transcriptional regulator [Nocardioides mangrovicus]